MNSSNPLAGDVIHGGAGLTEFDLLEDWLNRLKRDASYDTCRPGRSPSTTFLCIREKDQELIGICNLRHDLNQEYLLHISGHIGLSIRPQERRKGYGKKLLAHAIKEAKNLGISRILVTAAEANIASQKTILSLGGVFEDRRYNEADQEWMYRYWIEG